jgi:hypothetical protein
VFRLLQEDNKEVLKVYFTNHISDGLDMDVETIILKIYGQFSVLENN